MSAPRRWARRAALSMLAGSGITAVGFGGPFVGGALGAESPTDTTATTESPSPPVTATSPQAPAPTPGAGGAGASSTTTSSASSAPSSSSTSATPPAPTQTAPVQTTPVAQTPSVAPTVVVQRKQQVTPGKRRHTSVTGAGLGQGGALGGAGTGGTNKQGEGGSQGGTGTATNGPTTVAPGTPNGVAPAPLTAGGEAGALTMLFSGSTVSAQALDFYHIPLFLLPVYKAAAFQYDVPWQILAAINEVETDYGTDLSISTAGAVGWMQFMPSTWLQYGVDATDAGYADPYNPVDAIFAAARYLHAAGASKNLHAAILAYNHSQEYVESVMLRARLIASYPRTVIATLTGLVDGRSPTADARLAAGTELAPTAPASAGSTPGETVSPGVGSIPGETGSPGAGSSSSATAGATPVGAPPTPAGAAAIVGSGTSATPSTGPVGGEASQASSATGSSAGAVTAKHASSSAPSPQVAAARAQAAANAPAKPSQLVDLLGLPNAPVVAVEDGRVMHLGHSHSLGRYLVLRDIYGDVFTYAGLGSIAPRYRPAQGEAAVSRLAKAADGREEPTHDPAPTLPATAGHQSPLTLKVKAHASQVPAPASVPVEPEGESAPPGMGRVRLFAHPDNPVAHAAAARAASSANAGGNGWIKLRTGSIVPQGTVLGRLNTPSGASAGQLRFAVRPAGDSATIDPQPLLANWRQLGVALHPKGSKATGALLGATAEDALLMSRGELERAVLADPGIQLDGCARRDVASGTIDRRVLAVLEFLSRSGLQPTVAALRCPRGSDSPGGLSVISGPGSTSALAAAASRDVAHQRGAAVDISAINGIAIAGHQGPGTVTDAAIRTLLTLRGQFAPHRIVSLMRYPEAPTTEALAAEWNQIHIVFLPRGSVRARAASAGPTAASPLAATGDLSDTQWSQLIMRIGALPKPTVAAKPSVAAIRDPQAAPSNHGLGARG
jgi:hypothetical protein